MLHDSHAAPGRALPPTPSASPGSATPLPGSRLPPALPAREALPGTLNKGPSIWLVFVCFLSC